MPCLATERSDLPPEKIPGTRPIPNPTKGVPMLHFITGPAKSGKTHLLHSLISEPSVLQSGKVILLVPEQFSFETEREMLEKIGPAGLSRVDILSFTRFAERYLKEKSPNLLPEATDADRAAVMAKTMLSVSDGMVYFPLSKTDSRMINSLLKFDQDMKSASVSPSELRQVAMRSGNQALSEKCSELSVIMSAYDTLLNSFDDRKTALSRLADSLEKDDEFQDYTFFVDAFNTFSEEEYKVLRVLIRRAKDVYVTICADTEHGISDRTNIFYHPKRVFAKLTAIAKEYGIPVDTGTVLSNSGRYKNGLGELESGIFRREKITFDGIPDGITLWTSPDRLSECDAVARECKRLTREEGYRARDIAIIESSDGDYDRDMTDALRRAGLPVFEDRRHPVTDEPLIRIVSAAVNIATDGFDTDEICRYAKSSLSPISEEEINSLDNYCLMWQLKGSDWTKDWTGNPRGYGVKMEEKDETILRELNDLRRALTEPLSELSEKLAKGTGKQLCAALYSFLLDDRTGIRANLIFRAKKLFKSGLENEAVECSDSWDILMDALDAVAKITGEDLLTAKQFRLILRVYLSFFTVGEIPQGVDEIVIGSGARIRMSSPKAVFIVGCTRDKFPKSRTSTGLFSDSEKLTLIDGGALIDDRIEDKSAQERFIMYYCMTAATHRLYISKPAHDTDDPCIDGVPYTAIRTVFPALKILDAPVITPDNLESKADCFRLLASQFKNPSVLTATLTEYLEQYPEYTDKIQALHRAAGSSNVSLQDKSLARQLFGNDIQLSATKLDYFYNCPFKFFVRYGMRATTRQIAKPDAILKGNIIHYALEQTFRNYDYDTLLNKSPEERKALIRSVVDAYADENMSGKDKLPLVVRSLLGSYVLNASITLERILGELAGTRFKPVATEFKIGTLDGIPEYKIGLPDGGSAIVTGSIDRVDIANGVNKIYVRIVDYKSSEKKFSIDKCNYGLYLQMPVYLNAMTRDVSPFGKLTPAGLLYTQTKVITDSKDSVGRNPASDEVKNAKIKNTKMNGLMLDEAEIYTGDPKERDKYFDKNTKQPVDYGVFGKLLQTAEDKIIEMGMRLHDGDINIYPYTEKKSEIAACQFCEAKSVCLENYSKINLAESEKEEE